MAAPGEATDHAAAADGHLPTCWLSVIIPTHNRCQLTLRAVESVLIQASDRFPGVEVIVVDDGSTDDTVAALHLRHGHDPRVRLLRTPRRHACAARNAGMQIAHGELICFLDSDDLWQPHVLERVGQIFARFPELAFLSFEGSTLPKPTRPAQLRIVVNGCPGWSAPGFHQAPLRREPVTLADGTASLLLGDYFPAIIHADLFYLSGLIARRAAVLRAGPFTERFRYYNDWEFFARLCLQGPGGHLDEHGFLRDDDRDDQISRGHPLTAMPRRHLYILRTLPRRFPGQTRAYAEQIARTLADTEYWMGRCLLRAARPRASRRYLWRCLRQGYKTARCMVLLAASFAPHRQR